MLIISEIRGKGLEIKFLSRFFFYMFCSFIKQYKRQKIPYSLTRLFGHVDQILKYGLKKKTDSLINFTNYYNYGYMKATVKTKLKSGAYIVYIRIVHNRQSSFLRTPWMVRDDGVSANGKDVKDYFVCQQTSKLISQYYGLLNMVDCSEWSASEVASYLTKTTEDISFSDYARQHIKKFRG